MFKIFETQPKDFISKISVSACYIEIDRKFLLLKGSKRETWGVPGGKLELNETPLDAAHRELFEETGITSKSAFHFVGTLYVRTHELDFTYHMFKVPLTEIPPVVLSDEHLDFTWASLEEMKHLKLFPGEEFALQKVLQSPLA